MLKKLWFYLYEELRLVSRVARGGLVVAGAEEDARRGLGPGVGRSPFHRQD